MRFLLVALAACGSGHPTHPRFDATATASDILASLTVRTQGPPAVGLGLPATTKWGEVAPLGNLRGAGVYADGAVVVSEGVVYPVPANTRPFHELARPRLLRLTNKPTAANAWFEDVISVSTFADGTDLGAVFDDARQRWDDYAGRQTDALAAALPGQDAVTTTDVFAPSWSGNHIVVTYVRHAQRGDRAADVALVVTYTERGAFVDQHTYGVARR